MRKHFTLIEVQAPEREKRRFDLLITIYEDEVAKDNYVLAKYIRSEYIAERMALMFSESDKDTFSVIPLSEREVIYTADYLSGILSAIG